jgi:hypothetical protein
MTNGYSPVVIAINSSKIGSFSPASTSASTELFLEVLLVHLQTNFIPVPSNSVTVEHCGVLGGQSPEHSPRKFFEHAATGETTVSEATTRATRIGSFFS